MCCAPTAVHAVVMPVRRAAGSRLTTPVRAGVSVWHRIEQQVALCHRSAPYLENARSVCPRIVLETPMHACAQAHLHRAVGQQSQRPATYSNSRIAPRKPRPDIPPRDPSRRRCAHDRNLASSIAIPAESSFGFLPAATVALPPSGRPCELLFVETRRRAGARSPRNARSRYR